LNVKTGNADTVQAPGPMLRITSSAPDCCIPVKVPPSPSNARESWFGGQAGKLAAALADAIRRVKIMGL